MSLARNRLSHLLCLDRAAGDVGRLTTRLGRNGALLGEGEQVAQATGRQKGDGQAPGQLPDPGQRQPKHRIGDRELRQRVGDARAGRFRRDLVAVPVARCHRTSLAFGSELECPRPIGNGNRGAVLPSPHRHRNRAGAGEGGPDGCRSPRGFQREEAEVAALPGSTPLEMRTEIGKYVVDGVRSGLAEQRNLCGRGSLSHLGTQARRGLSAEHQPFGRSFQLVETWIRSFSRAKSVAPARVLTSIFPYTFMTCVCTVAWETWRALAICLLECPRASSRSTSTSRSVSPDGQARAARPALEGGPAAASTASTARRSSWPAETSRRSSPAAVGGASPDRHERSPVMDW